MGHIRVATENDKNQVTDLRMNEFKRSRDFKLLKPELLNWSAVDDNNQVMGIWDDQDLLISTLRLILVKNKDEASHFLECELPVAIKFPGLVFNSAATEQSNRRRGLNQLLRYYALQAAIDHDIQMLLSPVYQKAPRMDFMRKLGYQCHTMKHSWQTKLAPNSPRELAILRKSQMGKAIEIIQNKIPDLIKAYPWQGGKISFRD